MENTEKDRVLKELLHEWKKEFPRTTKYFHFEYPKYSPNYKGVRRKCFIYLRNLPTTIDRLKLAKWCQKMNRKEFMVEF